MLSSVGGGGVEWLGWISRIELMGDLSIHRYSESLRLIEGDAHLNYTHGEKTSSISCTGVQKGLVECSLKGVCLVNKSSSPTDNSVPQDTHLLPSFTFLSNNMA
ncbi:hypothetical protein Tco_1131452 [Tanacetum coccineum]